MTSLWHAIRSTKEERVAKLEWAANGGLGRATIGKVQYPFNNRPLFTQFLILLREWSRWPILCDKTLKLTYVLEPLLSLAGF